jgi:hypothetical protein
MRRVLAVLGAVLGAFFLFVLLVGLGAFLWFGLNPGSPALARMEKWPVVGEVASFLRSTGPPEELGDEEPPWYESPERDPAAEWSKVVVVQGTPVDPLRERPLNVPLIPGDPRPAEWGRLWVTPGMRLLAEPHEGAPEVAVLTLYTNARIVDQQPGWVKVEHKGQSGWLAFAEYDRVERPGGPRPNRPVEARPPDADRLARARGRLEPPETTGQLGPYLFYTDVRDADRLRALDRLAAEVEPAYRARYGLDPIGQPAEAVVLFAREDGYRAFQDEDSLVAGLPASGHNTGGLVAFFDGGRPRAEVDATLVHELAHLLNRRALGPLLPSWLDEGLASDLANSRIDASGHLEPWELGGAVQRFKRLIRWTGARSALRELAGAVEEGRLRPLPELLGLDWDGFVRRDAALNYAHAAFFVRYLLEGENGALAPGFRASLAAIATGRPAAEALLENLGRSWEELDAGFRAWVLAQGDNV